MPDIDDGETVEVQGSAKDPYLLRNVGGVYSCTCPAWRNQSTAIEKRTCKHLRQYCGEDAERARLGGEIPTNAARARKVSTPASASSGGTPSAGSSTAPPILLAHSWTTDVDLTGWWMSEKLDGVRAYWDGTQFISRQGNVYHAPDWFIEDLPKEHLDGELWLSRKGFQRAVSIVRRQDKSDQWKEITYLVFDAPAVDDVFEARMAYIAQLLDETQPKYARPHTHERCKGTAHLREELARVEELGGEGLMMRKPSSKYEVGRSFSLLKVKSMHDAEAKVIEHLPGTGRHKGRLGALSVELANGTKFSVGTGFSDAERDNPPPVGSVITFRYQELSDGGVPRFPAFVRVRTDIDELTSNLDGEPAGVKVLAGATSVKSVSGAAASKPAITTVPKPAVAAASKPAVASAPKSVSSPAAVQSGAFVAGATAPRMFEFTEGTSSKFWEVVLAGNEVIVRFGKIGTAGMTKPKSFPTPAAAKKYYDDLIGEKTGKGYVEVGGSPGTDSGDDDDNEFDDDDE
ncbi:MAG: DNA ligase [Cyanobacteria bacterium SZAS-4]|nr:DNA ligase [Cyanobacteria bacterium SZAS-4]